MFSYWTQKDPFTLALLLMRANLENSLKSNNHMNESATIYFNFIRSVIERTEGMALKPIFGSLGFPS